MINRFGFYKQQNKIAVSPPPPPLIEPPPPPPPPIEQPPQLFSSKPVEKRTFLRPEDYHPFQIPPNIDLAQLHCRATQFGVVSTANILQSQADMACNCCGQHEKNLIAVCAESRRIYKVSEAQGFYFTYIKVIVVALSCIFLLQGLYTLITTISYCSSSKNSCLEVYGMPLPQDLAYFNTGHIVLGIVSAFLLYPFVLYLFYLRGSIHQRLKQSVIKISDYSLLISGVDPQKLSDRELVAGLQGHAIDTVLFTHRIGKYLVAMRKRYILQAKKNLYFKRGLQQKHDRVVRQIYEIGNIVLPFKNCINIGNERQLRTDKIIVKFRTSEDRQIFFRKYHVNLCTRGYNVLIGRSPFVIKGVPLYVESLGEPEQMVWENLQVPMGYKFFMMAVNTIVSAIILGGSFAIILLLTREENKEEVSNQVSTSFGMAVLIEIVNVVLYLAIFQLTEAECRITLTGKMMARIIRNVFVFFFNTTLIPFSLFLLDWIDNDRKLVYQYIVSLFFVTNLVSPLSPIFNPFHLYKIYCRRKIKQEGRDCLFTQLETNQVFEKNDFQLQLKYQLLCQRIMNCCFYAAVFPQVLLLTIAGLALDYWIEKWWLLNHCCIPKFSGRLASVINRVSIFFPVVYLFGYLANLLMMRDQHSLFDSDSDPLIISCFLGLSLAVSLLIFVLARRLVAGWVRGREVLMEESSVSIKELDYGDLNPTSFLHIDLKNTVDLTLQNRNRVIAREDNFQRIEQFVLKQQTEALVRRESESAIRISRLKEVE